MKFKNDDFNRRVEDFNFAPRINNILKNLEIKYIGELIQKTPHELIKERNFGKKSIQDIQDALRPLGLGLGMNIEEVAFLNLKDIREKWSMFYCAIATGAWASDYSQKYCPDVFAQEADKMLVEYKKRFPSEMS